MHTLKAPAPNRPVVTRVAVSVSVVRTGNSVGRLGSAHQTSQSGVAGVEMRRGGA